MGFGREMEQFIAAWQAGTKINAVNEDIYASRQNRGLIDDPMGPSNFRPGTGSVGETEAPKADDGKSGGGGGKAGPIAWKGASPEQRAFLMTLSGPESAGDYSVIYGGDHFNDFSKHPGRDVPIESGPNKGKTSSAAGRYQFIGSTWNNIASKYHITDFSPESQDMGAWYLATEEYGRQTGRDLNSDLKSKDPAVIAGIGRALRGQWTSLPGGIEQGTNEDAFVSTYNKFLTAAPEGGEAAPALTQGIEPDVKPAPAATIAADSDTGDEQDQEDVAPAEIDVMPYTATEEEAPAQVEDGFQQMMGYQQGGAIPDDMGSGMDSGGFMQFADGGNINPARDYTQNIAAPTVTMTPRINTNVLAKPKPTVAGMPKNVVKPLGPQYKTPAVNPNLVGPGGTSPLPVVPGRYPGAPGARGGGYSLVHTADNMTNLGRNNRFQDIFAKAQKYGVNALSPGERQALLSRGMLRAQQGPGQNVRGLTPVPKFARGGKVTDRDTRFQELLRQESRGSGAGTQGGSARDRAARRLNREEGGPSSTYYRPSRPSTKFPAAPKAPGGGGDKGGGGGPLHVRHPPNPTVGTPARSGPRHPPNPSAVREEGYDYGAPGKPALSWSPWNTDDKIKEVKRPAEVADTDTTKPDKAKSWKQPQIDVPALKPDEDEKPWFSYARGGAIPDDEEKPSLFKRIVRGGQKPNLREFKRKAGTLKEDAPPETKSAKRKKPKDASKPQKRDQKKTKQRTGGLPSRAPRPGQRPGPEPDRATPVTPDRVSPIQTSERVSPIQTQPGLTVKSGYPHVQGEEVQPLQEDRATRDLRGPGERFPFPGRAAPPPPAPAAGGVMSPIPGVAAPVSSAMDVPRGGTWSPPGAPPAAPPGPQQGPPMPFPSRARPTFAQPDKIRAPQGGRPSLPPSPGAQPAQPQNGPSPAPIGPAGGAPGEPISGMGGAVGAGDAVINASDTIETLMQKLQAIKAKDLAYPATAQPGFSPPQYAKGGAIPDDTPNFPEAGEAGYDASSADTGQVAPGQQDRIAAVERANKSAGFDEVAQRAAPSVRVGVQGLSRIFGIDPTGQQGVPDEASGARQEDGIRRFASGEGAATRQEIQAIDASFGNDRVQADEATKNLMRIDQVVNFWLQRGDKEKAEAAAASLLQAGSMEVRNAGTNAAAMFEEYQRTGDVNALRHASQMVERAYSMIPDGSNIKIDIDPKTRQIVATTVDANGKSQKQVVDPQAIPGLLKQAMDGSAYWTSTFQIGQPRLAEQQLQTEGTAANQRIAREENQAYDEYKFQRGEDAKLGAEERAAQRWEQQQEYQTEHGRSPGERSSREMQQFYDSLQEDMAGTQQGSPERKALVEEGLSYRFDNTRDRQDAVEEDSFRFLPESPHASTFEEADVSAVRDIARVIAQKEPAMDGTTAMEVTSALVTAPELEFYPDGTMNVNGNSIVFNPALLPQLGQLRNKYRQQ